MKFFRLFPLVLLAFPTTVTADEPFYLKDGDRVVFYGDSITDQRLYTTFVETFVVTRFPKMNVKFVHSGWGGDRVTGGGGGPVDRRLWRDVFAYKPTVVTVMLGMNDAGYRAFDGRVFDNYAKGYQHIVDSVKEHIPGVRMTLIQPSPFDDVTRKPNFEEGYNAVLVRYGEFVRELAMKNGLDIADLNTEVVAATKKAFLSDPDDAQKLNPDRVHPAPSGQLLMAAALLKAWNAPTLVSEVKIKVDESVGSALGEGRNTRITDITNAKGTLSWTQRDDALPFPINLEDRLMALAVRSSDVVHALDRQPLEVKGLPEGSYALEIDDVAVGTYTSDQLADGINLAIESTPMVKQAAGVHQLTLKHNNTHYTRWRQVQVPLAAEDADKMRVALDALDAIEADVVQAQRAAAQPKARVFELIKK
jgi:lysophospholipase L1-like esterase